MRSRPVLLTVSVLGLVLAARLWAQPPSVHEPLASASTTAAAAL